MSIRSKNKTELKVAGAKLPSTGTYRFKTGFYGLTSMPAEFQRVMDSILLEFPQAHAFIDDVLITTKGSEIEHIPTVEKILKKLHKENMELKLSKCKFAQRECEWLEHRITPTGITPLVRKTVPIEALHPPRTLLQLKSFMGSIHSLHKYTPALAESSAPLRPFLSRKMNMCGHWNLTYAYGQLPLRPETSVQCIYSLVGGRSTGTYRFKTGFYGLTSMPAEFQRVMDSILSEFPHAHAFIDDILITTKGSENEHIPTVEKILKKLDKENMELKLSKSKFAQRECEWLGHRITPTEITPLVRKTVPIEALHPPRTLLQLKSFMGSIRSLHKYMPALAESSAPLRPLLSRKIEHVSFQFSQASFDNLKNQIANIVELNFFDVHKYIRIVCDASHNGLGAVLEQLGTDGWRPISFASRYLNDAEKRYSANELEMLAVV